MQQVATGRMATASLATPDRIAYYPGMPTAPAVSLLWLLAPPMAATARAGLRLRPTAMACDYGLRLWSTAMAFDAGMITSCSAKWLQSGEHERARLQAG